MLKQIKPQLPILIKDLGFLYPKETSNQKRHFGIFRCSCGKEFRAINYNVTHGSTYSCGCFQKIKSKTHGLSGNKLYGVWRTMKNRCNNKNTKSFIEYGQRGIKICDQWNNDFISFYSWVMENGYKEGLTIDRINNDGNYEPSNCRLANMNIQARNKRMIMSTNTSGYRGVSYRKDENKFVAQIVINSHHKTLGSFKNALDAAKVYDSYVIEHNLEHTINGVRL